MRRLNIKAWDDYSFFAQRHIELVGPNSFYAQATLSAHSSVDVPIDLEWLAFGYERLTSNVVELPRAERVTIRLERNYLHPHYDRKKLPFLSDFFETTYEKEMERRGEPAKPLTATIEPAEPLQQD
ncbi:MAG: hypothetical protein HRU11_13505 [Parvularculaceae bacterium]|nr:hypothetical protein [Parvularculaceae bacterium]